MDPSWIGRVVAASCRHALLLIACFLILGAAAGYYSATHFELNSDTAQLISPDLPWRQRQDDFDKAFPQLSQLILVVVDGDTPELAEEAASGLTTRLSARKDLFLSVRRPDGGPFFNQNGLLFLSVADVQAATQAMIKAQPFLGPLAADPSLRGIFGSLSTAMMGVEHGQAKLDDLHKPLTAFSDVLDKTLAGKSASLSWRALFNDAKPGTRELRRFILVKPKLDFSALSPGERAGNAIREIARKLGFTPDRGVRVRLTGDIPLSDDEFASLADRAGLMAALMLASVMFVLWLAVKSARIIACILITLLVGLSITTAFGIAVAGSLNLISVAFIALFVGLGVDFGIQVSVRYRAERHAGAQLVPALIAAAEGIGTALTLAAAAIAAGFFAFLPTDYRGVAELGLIAGAGMIVAYVLSLTMLPALLKLARPGSEAADVGISALASADRFLEKNRRLILGIAALLAIVSLGLLPYLQFDFNTLDMKNPHMESMSTLRDLMKAQDNTPNTIDILMPSLGSARALAVKLDRLPEVAHSITLQSFVPDDQAKKLAAIGDASMLLGPTFISLGPFNPPTDAQTVQTLKITAAKLRSAAGGANAAAAKPARRLAGLLERLAAATPAVRARAGAAFVPALKITLAQIRNALNAQPVSLQALPADLKRDWLAPDGRARINVVPRGDSNNLGVLKRFTAAVQNVAPDATGAPISIQEAGNTIVGAFVEAGVLSFIAIMILLGIALRNVWDVMATLLPLLLTGALTLATCVAIGLPINFANIIALPLLFGIGVAFNIYFVMAWRRGMRDLLRSSLARAVITSAMTTASGFGTLWLSSHLGLSSMGELLMISLGWTLATALLFTPALLGAFPQAETIRRP